MMKAVILFMFFIPGSFAFFGVETQNMNFTSPIPVNLTDPIVNNIYVGDFTFETSSPYFIKVDDVTIDFNETKLNLTIFDVIDTYDFSYLDQTELIEDLSDRVDNLEGNDEEIEELQNFTKIDAGLTINTTIEEINANLTQIVTIKENDTKETQIITINETHTQITKNSTLYGISYSCIMQDDTITRIIKEEC